MPVIIPIVAGLTIATTEKAMTFGPEDGISLLRLFMEMNGLGDGDIMSSAQEIDYSFTESVFEVMSCCEEEDCPRQQKINDLVDMLRSTIGEKILVLDVAVPPDHYDKLLTVTQRVNEGFTVTDAAFLMNIEFNLPG